MFIKIQNKYNGAVIIDTKAIVAMERLTGCFGEPPFTRIYTTGRHSFEVSPTPEELVKYINEHKEEEK